MCVAHYQVIVGIYEIQQICNCLGGFKVTTTSYPKGTILEKGQDVPLVDRGQGESGFSMGIDTDHTREDD